MKVVLVDDDEDIRVICRLSLQTVGGWQVAVASSGPEGIELAAQERPDVVLLDVMMPGQDGLTTYAAMKDDPRTAHIPVVLMTAKAQARELARFLALGVAGVALVTYMSSLTSLGYTATQYAVLTSTYAIVGKFLKGLVKLSAAGIKVREESIHGVRRHAASAGEVFADVAADDGTPRHDPVKLANAYASFMREA